MNSETAVLGADIANQQAGGGSLFDNTRMFTGSAVLSGFASIWNTFASAGNYLGGDIETVDVSRVLSDYDTNWYKYYQENKQLVDVAGFVGTSLIPGTLGIKGLKAAQAGYSAGAIGRTITGPLSLFQRKRDEYLAKGLQAIASEGGTAYSYLNANKWASISWGAADNVLQAAAFEGAAVLTMAQSPIFADAGKVDILKDIAFGAFIGGGFGGAIEGIVINRMFKDTLKQINQRAYKDTPEIYSRMGLGIGDEAAGMVEAYFSIPKTVRESDQMLNVFNTLGKKNIELNISKALESQLDKASREAYMSVQTTLGKLGSQNTPEVGQAWGKMILGMIKRGEDSGTPVSEIQRQVGDYLYGLKKSKVLRDAEPLNTADVNELFYLADEIDIGALAANPTIDQLFSLARSRTPFEKNATAKPWRVVGDISQAKVTANATSFKEAWDNGFDLAVIGGKMRINNRSTIFEKVRDPTLIPSRYINTRTGVVGDEVVATFADTVPAGKKTAEMIVNSSDGKVLYDGKVHTIGERIDPSNSITATARHAWAANLDARYFADRTIDVRDISRLDRLVELGLSTDDLDKLAIHIAMRDGSTVRAANVDLTNLVVETKLDQLTKLLDDPAKMWDPREIAYMLNVQEEWVERAMAMGFTRTGEDNLANGVSRKLGEYLERENFIATWASPKKLVELGVVTEDALTAAAKAANNKGATYVDTFVTGDLGFRQRVDALLQLHRNAFAAVVGGEWDKQFLNITNVKDFMAKVDELGVGSSFFGFSNANYGDLPKLWAQYTGKLTHQLSQEMAKVDLERLMPFTQKLREDLKSGAELGIIVNMLRRSSDKFEMLAPVAANGRPQLVVRDIISVNKESGERFIDGTKLTSWQKANPNKKAVFEIESDTVVEFLTEWRNMNAEFIAKRTTLMNARGAVVGWDPKVIYAPPIDTRRYPYFAFVKVKEGHIASNSDVGMITARSAEDLNKLIKELPENYQAYTKRETEAYFKVKDEYDAQLALNEPRVDSTLRKDGKLGDVFYEVRPENIMEDFTRYVQDSRVTLARHAVEVRYTQLFEELRSLGKQYTDVATSQMSGASRIYDKSAVDPFGDYIRTALDISKRSSFPLISKLNEFVDSAGTTAWRIITANSEKAQKGLISWQEAEKIAMRYGVGGVYANAGNVEEAFKIANRIEDRNLIREAVSKANMFIANVGLRLDVANSIVNTISLPIMLGTEMASIRSLAKTNPEALGALNELTKLRAAGEDVPSTTVAIGRAISNILGPGGKDLIAQYRASGDVKNVMLQFHEMLGELAINPQLGVSGWKKAVDKAVEKGATWTGNNFAEDFTRALSANVMDQYTAPLVAKKLLTSQEAAAYRSVFVNRVNGNYISSQRPIAFQGTVGAAVSLFQTYVFNVMQQLLRHVENRDTKALLTMGGLQGAIYGANGIPFFEAVNTHLIGNANINDGHRDIYSTTTQLAGSDLGNWLMYGTASALPFFGGHFPALYTRGDINPRHISILPVNPLDVPAVDVSVRVVKNIADMGRKIVSGADISASLLEGLEHNGVSRPLAGFAQLMQRYTSTSKGSLISAQNELNLVVAGARMIGARPLDESIALNAMFREQAYKAADLERLAKLGEVVKTKLRHNQVPTDEELFQFMKDYASVGGTLQNYSSALQRWTRDANMSVVEQMKRKHNNTYAQRLSEIMGGSTLDDFMSAQGALSQQ